MAWSISPSVRAAVKVCRREAVGDERYERELRGAKLYRVIPPQEGLVRMRELVETEWGFYTVMDLADDEFDGPRGSGSSTSTPDSYFRLHARRDSTTRTPTTSSRSYSRTLRETCRHSSTTVRRASSGRTSQDSSTGASWTN